MGGCVCVCVCACLCLRARVGACVCVYVYRLQACMRMKQHVVCLAGYAHLQLRFSARWLHTPRSCVGAETPLRIDTFLSSLLPEASLSTRKLRTPS